MSVMDNLDALRRALPGCSVVALGDLSAELVLCASHSGQVPQERLDSLCAAASALLGAPQAGRAARLMGAGAGRGPDMAVVMTGLDTRVFLRSPVDEADVLCCVCGRNVDITDAAELARSTLTEISAQP
ncbi:MAG: hypothetical protein KDK02_07820 [Rhodobacteraceae bacterium]|nr:hypothetical protein [Paracoccaceae bacterium]